MRSKWILFIFDICRIVPGKDINLTVVHCVPVYIRLSADHCHLVMKINNSLSSSWKGYDVAGSSIEEPITDLTCEEIVPFLNCFYHYPRAPSSLSISIHDSPLIMTVRLSLSTVHYKTSARTLHNRTRVGPHLTKSRTAIREDCYFYYLVWAEFELLEELWSSNQGLTNLSWSSSWTWLEV